MGDTEKQTEGLGERERQDGENVIFYTIDISTGGWGRP